MTLHKVGVIGAGTMGNGIAQACAMAGIDVVMVDVGEAAVLRGLSTVTTSLDRLHRKDKITAADKEAALSRIKGTTDYEDLKACDLVIEAATENEELKYQDSAGRWTPSPGPSRSSRRTRRRSRSPSLPRSVSRPESFLGMHFFNPVPMMALVELIRGLQTSDATVAAGEALAKRLGKTPIVVRNSPGFVVNRILCPMINEAIFVLHEGLATAEEIDAGMKLGCNHPDRPAGACRHDRARHDARRHGGVLPRLQRSEIPAGAAAEGNGRRRPSRAQDRPRVLRLSATARP